MLRNLKIDFQLLKKIENRIL